MCFQAEQERAFPLFTEPISAHPVAMELVVVLCTFPNMDVAREIATRLVELRVAACVNLAPGAHSIYRWQGKIETADEVLGFIKTTRSLYPTLEQNIKALHPYDVPEIVMLPAEQAQERYAQFVREAVTAKG
jgi:periplasmic divalent cation tolerance protein